MHSTCPTRLIRRDRDTDANGSLDETLYALQDANFNVTALSDTSGVIVERFAYTAYGRHEVLTGSFGSRSSSSYDWETRYAGYRYDTASGLYHVRHRVLHAGLGHWLQRDPLGYVDGGNLYEYVASMPHAAIDPMGLEYYYEGTGPTRLPDGRLVYNYNLWETVDPWFGPPERRYRGAEQVVIDPCEPDCSTPCDWDKRFQFHADTLNRLDDAVGRVHTIQTAGSVVPGFRSADLAQQGDWGGAAKAGAIDTALTVGGGALLKGGACVIGRVGGRMARPGPSFVVSPRGTAVPVPRGATGPSLARNGRGFVFGGGRGGSGLADDVNAVRIMDDGYVNYGKTMDDGGWQSVCPRTGRPLHPSDPEWHIPIDLSPLR